MEEQERRSSPRMTLDVPIKLEGSSVYLRDVSISGAQIECDRVLEIGSRADLSLNIPADYHRFFGEKRQIALQMDVKWCNPHPTIPDLYEAGGEITSIEDQSKRDLFSYLSFFCGPLDAADPSAAGNGPSQDSPVSLHDERIKILGRLAGGIAHDFNNHLMIILGRLQMLRMKDPPAELDRHALKAEKAAEDAAELVKRLQDFSHQTSPIPMGPVQLNAVVETSLSTVKTWAERHSKLSEVPYDFVIDFQRPLFCTGIAVDLQTAFICLLKNAMEAMPDGGEVRVTTRAEGAQAFVEITDQGPGLDPSVRDHVLEPFVTTRKGRTRGLGLTIAKGIVQRHCGRLEIADRAERGVRCTVCLETRSVSEPDARVYVEEALTEVST